MDTTENPVLGWFRSKLSRRGFVKTASAAAAAAAVLPRVRFARAETGAPTGVSLEGEIIRSACMMCNAGCGIQVTVKDGVATRIVGNPYCPHTNDYDTGQLANGADVKVSDLPKANTLGGSLCPRGAAGLMTTYDPLRLTTPLKRTGARGSGMWTAISWEQAIQEICWGGLLPDGDFEGLAQIRDIVNSISAADTDFAADAKAGNPANYGLKSNQLAMVVGRDQTGEATGRFMTAFGSINRLDHTSLCNSSYKAAGYLTFCGDAKDKGQYDFKPDIDGADVLMLFGTSYTEANVTNPLIRKLAAFKKRGGKLIVVDPRLSNTATKADRWVKTIKQGTDAALALGLCRWLIDSGKHSTEYLRRSHKSAPNGAGTAASTGWTDGAYVVNQTTKKYVTALDAALDGLHGVLAAPLLATASPTTAAPTVVTLNAPGGGALNLSGWPSSGNVKIGSELFYYAAKDDALGTLNITVRKVKGSKAADLAAGAVATLPFVVAIGGALNGYHKATTAAGAADLEHRGTLGANPVASAFAMFRDSLLTVADYATECGVSAADIAAIGAELTAPGKRVCVDMYRGATAGTNGVHTVRAIYMLNILLDRVDRKGGWCLAKRYKGGTPALPGAPTPKGVRFDRATSKYEGTNVDPARPWFPLAYLGVQQEVWPSIKMGYPYRAKALISFTTNAAYTTPYTKSVIECLSDRAALPLHVAVDIFMSETTQLADYVLPDCTYLEKWSNGVLAGYAAVHTTAGNLRRPVVGWLDPQSHKYTPVLPDTKSMDDILIMLGKELGLPGYGKDGMGAGKHLHNAWDFYNEMYKSGDLAMPNGLADPTHDIMVMGGRRKNPGVIYDTTGEFITDDAKYKNLVTIFCEWMTAYKHSYTHKAFEGLPIYEKPHMDAGGNVIVEPAEFKFTFVNYKMVQQVQSRSTSNKWLQEIQPENPIWLNPADAAAAGIENGDRVRVRSPKLAAYGRAHVTETVQPGSVAVSHSFGRWAFGAKPYWADGEEQPNDPSVARGIAMNPLIRPDPFLGDVCCTDPIGGSAENSSTRVAVEKA